MSRQSRIRRAKRRLEERRRENQRTGAALATYRPPPLDPLLVPPPRADVDLARVAREIARSGVDVVVVGGEKPLFVRPSFWRHGDLCPLCSAGALQRFPRTLFIACASCGRAAPETERPPSTLSWCRVCKRFHGEPACTPETPRKYVHGEAFCRMKYARKDGSGVEWVWNSRDGVTPFLVGPKGRQGPFGDDELLSHVDWHLDQVRPDYKPQPGERVFIDLTPELARANAEKWCDRYWDHPEFPLSEGYATKEEAIESHLRDEARDGAPVIITVGSEGWTPPAPRAPEVDRG